MKIQLEENLKEYMKEKDRHNILITAILCHT